MNDDHSPRHCGSDHETILYELQKLQEELAEERKETKKNTVARIKAETIVDLIRMIGVMNLIGIITGAILYLSK